MAIFLFIVAAFIALGIYNSVNKSRQKKELLLQYSMLSQTVSDFSIAKLYTQPDGNCYIALDTQRKKFLFAGRRDTKGGQTIWHKVVDFKDILKSEILVDGQTISTKSAGGALAGGLLFGTVGAVVGSNTGTTRYRKDVTNVKLKVIINDLVKPTYEMIFYNKTVNKNISPVDAQAQCQAWQDTIVVAMANTTHAV
jgi:hypothetical protein